jgi:hypothetical protein
MSTLCFKLDEGGWIRVSGDVIASNQVTRRPLWYAFSDGTVFNIDVEDMISLTKQGSASLELRSDRKCCMIVGDFDPYTYKVWDAPEGLSGPVVTLRLNAINWAAVPEDLRRKAYDVVEAYGFTHDILKR